MREAGKAAQLLAQHKLLHTEWGPQPWGDKLKALFEQVKGSLPEPAVSDMPGRPGGKP